MAGSVLVDAGYVVGLLHGRDTHHAWAVAQAARFPRPWVTCESVLSEAFHLLGVHGAPALTALLRRGVLRVGFVFTDHRESVLKLMDKYADVPIGFADACLVRMTEMLSDPVVLTTDTDFRVYRRHGRQAIPCVIP